MATPTNLPASFTSEVLTSAAMNNLRGAFRILQVVQGTTSTSATNATSTYADTNLTATITPQSSSSKILVLVNQVGGDKNVLNTQNAIALRLMRGATQIALIAHSAGYTNTLLNLRVATMSTAYLDSPATTSATTYKTQFMCISNASGVSVQIGGDLSTITLLEVSA